MSEPKCCPKCGHDYHIGNGLGDICIGCPCDYKELTGAAQPGDAPQKEKLDGKN